MFEIAFFQLKTAFYSTKVCIGSLFVDYFSMQKGNFQFENQIFVPKSRPDKPVTKLFILTSFFLSLGFVGFKNYGLFSSFYQNLSTQAVKTQKPLSKAESRTLPLLVSLKGQDGPRLARVFVSIYLDSQNVKKPFDKEIENLENQLLFLLSGQSITYLSDKSFQDQIQNQLNLFLSHQMIQDLNIKTELLNKTRSSL